jgi:ATP-dependent Zn protease
MNENRKPGPQKPDEKDEEKRRERMQRQMRFSLGYIITAVIALWLFQEFVLAPLLIQQARQLDYSEFRQKLAAGQIVSVTIGENDILGQMKNPHLDAKPETVPFDTIFTTGSDPKLVEDLRAAGVKFSFLSPETRKLIDGEVKRIVSE